MATQTTISPLQLYKPQNFSGLTDSGQLARAFMTKPHELGVFLTKRFGSYYQKTLQLLTGGLGNTRFVDVDEYDWMLYGDEKRTTAVAIASPDASATTGIGYQQFRIILEDNWYSINDVLVSDSRDYMVQVKTEPQSTGSYFTYGVQLVTGDPTKFIPSALIAPGARFSKQWNAVEEFSETGGEGSYTSGVKLRNNLTTLRRSYSVTGSAASDVAYLDLVNPKDPSKRTKLWATMAEWKNYADFTKEIDNALFYGKSNKTADNSYEMTGPNGRVVKYGAGLREQIAPANIRYYSQLSYDFLQDFLTDLSYNATQYGGNTKFVAFTGKQGMIEFDKAMRKEVGRLNLVIDSGKGQFVTGSGQNLVFEGQFTKVKFLNGIELTVTEFGPYDDKHDNRELHPISKKPIESYRFTILNFGSDSKGNPNIMKVAKRKREMLAWHEGGSVSPNGETVTSLQTLRSNGFDGFKGHYLAEIGICLTDPLSCGELIFQAE